MAYAFCRARSLRPMIINFLHYQRKFLDKLAPRLHLLAHEHAEHLIGLQGVFQVHLHQHALRGVERGLPQFLAVHFAETLEAGDGHAALAEMADGAYKLAEMGQDAAQIAVLEREARLRLAAGEARRLDQAGGIEAKLLQTLQAPVDAAHFMELLHEEGI